MQAAGAVPEIPNTWALSRRIRSRGVLPLRGRGLTPPPRGRGSGSEGNRHGGPRPFPERHLAAARGARGGHGGRRCLIALPSALSLPLCRPRYAFGPLRPGCRARNQIRARSSQGMRRTRRENEEPRGRRCSSLPPPSSQSRGNSNSLPRCCPKDSLS